MSDSKIDILLLGSGGREHAPLTKLAESPRAGKMWVAPGNGGMDATAEVADMVLPEGEWRAVPPFAGEDNPVIMAVWHGPAHGVCVFQRS